MLIADVLLTSPHLPFVDLMILSPMVASIWIMFAKNSSVARRRTIVSSMITLVLASAGWIDHFLSSDHVSSSMLNEWLGLPIFAIDSLNSPVILMTALIYLMTPVMTVRTKMPRFSFAGSSFGESLVLTSLVSMQPALIAAFMSIACLIPWYELRARRASTRLFMMHMVAFIVVMWAGVLLLPTQVTLGSILVAGAVAIRTGLPPFHLWVSDLLSQATFGRCLLFLTPMPAAYLVTRVLVPVAPEFLLSILGWHAVIAAFYAAGLAIVQTDVRRFFCYFYLGQAAIVLIGLEAGTQLGLTGSLSAWISSTVALSALGLTLRALEARHGTLSLGGFQGLHHLSPALARGYLISAFACVGFPGTLGFVGMEIVFDATLQSYPVLGIIVVLASALFGIAAVKAYFELFSGKPRCPSVLPMHNRRESLGIMLFAAILILGGVYPNPIISSRSHAAKLIARPGDQSADKQHHHP